MKKLFITAAIATMFSVTAFADGGKKATTESSEKYVSYTALNEFKSTFKGADNALWTVTANCQKVSFTENNTDFTAFYDLSGEYLGLTQNVAYSTLAPSVKKEVLENYKGYVVSNVIKFTTNETDESVVHFIDLKNATSEIVVKVTPNNSVSYFKTVK
jgi:hypothetical protein